MAGQNLPDAKAVSSQIECPRRANFMEAAAPIAPMVPTPMVTELSLNAIFTEWLLNAIVPKYNIHANISLTISTANNSTSKCTLTRVYVYLPIYHERSLFTIPSGDDLTALR